MDLIIVNLAGVTPQLAFGVGTLVLVGGIVAYRIHKSKTRKLQKVENPNEIGDYDDCFAAEYVDDNSDVSDEYVEVSSPSLVRKAVNRSKMFFTHRYTAYAVLTTDELVDIYRKLAYKKQLSDGEKREYNIVSSLLAKKSVFLTQKGYDFVREEYRKE